MQKIISEIKSHDSSSKSHHSRNINEDDCYGIDLEDDDENEDLWITSPLQTSALKITNTIITMDEVPNGKKNIKKNHCSCQDKKSIKAGRRKRKGRLSFSDSLTLCSLPSFSSFLAFLLLLLSHLSKPPSLIFPSSSSCSYIFTYISQSQPHHLNHLLYHKITSVCITRSL